MPTVDRCCVQVGQYKYKLNAQYLRLFDVHSDVNDAHRAGANRLQNKNYKDSWRGAPRVIQKPLRSLKRRKRTWQQGGMRLTSHRRCGVLSSLCPSMVSHPMSSSRDVAHWLSLSSRLAWLVFSFELPYLLLHGLGTSATS